jgi:hypothetical protein
MKHLQAKFIFSDRFILSTIIIGVFLIVITLITFASSGRLERKNRALHSQLNKMETMKEELVQLRELVDTREKKIGLTEVSGVISALEQMLEGLGIEAKSIKPLEKRTSGEFTEENAELEIENIDINTMVNLLYRIDTSPVPFKIKDVSIRTTFENPDMYILSLTASLIGK